jgi:hypothetical protein
MDEYVTDTVDSSTAPLSFPARLMGIFVSPVETLADVARHPDFWAPLIALVVASVVVVETLLRRIGADRIARSSIMQSSQAARMPIEDAVHRLAPIMAISYRIGAWLGSPFVLLVLAGLGILIVNLIFGAKMTFKAVFSLVCYANLVSLLSSLMAVAVMLFGDPEHINPLNPVPGNLAFFLNPSEVSKRTYALASSADVFTVWMLVLVAIGLSEGTERKVKPLHIFLVYGGLWLVWILLKAGMASL